MQNDSGFLCKYWYFVPLNQDQEQFLDLDLNLYVGLGENKQNKRHLSKVKFDDGYLVFGPWGFYLRKEMHRVVEGGINSSWPSNDWK